MGKAATSKGKGDSKTTYAATDAATVDDVKAAAALPVAATARVELVQTGVVDPLGHPATQAALASNAKTLTTIDTKLAPATLAKSAVKALALAAAANRLQQSADRMHAAAEKAMVAARGDAAQLASALAGTHNEALATAFETFTATRNKALGKDKAAATRRKAARAKKKAAPK